MMDRQRDISALLGRPDFFPMRVDLQRHAVVFTQMSRETFRRSSFLDQRAILAGPDTRFVDLDELFEQLPAVSGRCPVHFILHGAFCGSTLLARHFETLPRCLVLKEPQLLAQIALLRHVGPEGARSRPLSDWLDAALTLLSRSEADDAAVVIKAPDQLNWLANRLLDRDRTAKMIFLAAPLRVFLLSALKSPERRGWLRSRARGLRLQLAQVPLRDELVADVLTDGQLGAALWLLNSFLCINLLSRPESQRVLALNSEELIGRPREAFHEAVDFLGLTRDEDVRQALGQFRPLGYHSKDSDARIRFDAAARGVALAEIEKRFGREVDAAVAWASKMGADWLGGSPFPLD